MSEQKQDGPSKKAIALKYEPELYGAPRVVAKGGGVIAQQIIDLAQRHGVVLKEDPLLTQALATLDVGQVIPPHLYQVVAEVFAWLYGLDGHGPDEGEAGS